MKKAVKSREVKIRPAKTEDVLAIVEVRCDAILNIAATHYDPSSLEEWAGTIDEERVETLLSNSADIRIVAEIDAKIIGYGELVTKENIVGACYVSPSVGGQGIGEAIVVALEHIAREKGLTYLQLESSANAEKFYLDHGYQVIERSKHAMQSGTAMDCVMMRKDL